MDYLISPMLLEDWEQVKTIYLAGISTGNATFETSAPEWDKWDSNHIKTCRLVIKNIQGEVSGWAALSPVSNRCIYAGVAEVSIYISAQTRGKGIGYTLLQALIRASEENGIWTLQAGIMAENQASIRLHEKAGFRLVGRRESIGKLAGIWRDVVLMERRSTVVGVD